LSDISIKPESPQATSLWGNVLTKIVYYDDAVVRVAVRALDSLFNAPAAWRRVQVFAIPSAELGDLDATVATAFCNKATKADAGLCIVQVPVGMVCSNRCGLGPNAFDCGHLC
jgi:hypothetical protein